MRRAVLCIALAPLVRDVGAGAADWPQILGPARDGVYTGVPLAESWDAGGPRVIWRRAIGAGFSGPVVAGGRLILFHRAGSREVVEAIDLASGRTEWKYDYPTRYRDDFGFDEGPRAVPVAADGVVYVFGAEGQLHAIELSSGRKLWSEDTMHRFGVPKGFFGAAGSPIVEGGAVIANIGGTGAGIVAFDAKTGQVRWTATDDQASYSSGIAATFGGRRHVVFLTRNGLVGLDPSTGQVRFQRTWRARQAAAVNAATPVVVGDSIFVSAEYGPGAGVLKVVDGQLTDVWASDDALSNHYATSVHLDGYLYGFHGRQEFGQSLRAVEFQTGRMRWSEERFGAGSLIRAGNRLVILRESGELVIAAATPDRFTALARAQILPATVRAYPAVSDGVLYARNETTLVAVDLRK